MSTKVRCPRCSQTVEIQSDEAGGVVACPSCGQKMKVKAKAPDSGPMPAPEQPQQTSTPPPGYSPTPGGGRQPSATPPPLPQQPQQQTISCTQCGQSILLTPEMAGQQFACPNCNGQFTAPGGPAQTSYGYQPQYQAPQQYPPQQYGAPGPYGPAGGYSYAGPKENAPGAVGSLVCGIFAVLCCGFILGIVAIVLGNSAKGKIRDNPQLYTGGGMATAGIVLGILGIIKDVLVTLGNLSQM